MASTNRVSWLVVALYALTFHPSPVLSDSTMTMPLLFDRSPPPRIWVPKGQRADAVPNDRGATNTGCPAAGALWNLASPT